MIIIDASVVLDLLLGYRREPIEDRLVDGGRVLAPELLDAEVGQVLRRLLIAKTITRARTIEALGDFSLLQISRAPHRPLLDSAFRLASNVSFYDALYVALAVEVGGTLVTRDEKLAKAASRNCTIELV